MMFKNSKNIIFSTVFVILCLLLGVNAKAQDTLSVVIKNAPFILFNSDNGFKYSYQTSEELVREWRQYSVAKGTKVVALGLSEYDAMVKVMLPDGSIGFMSTAAFAVNQATFCIETKTDTYPAGKSKLVDIGKILFMSDIEQEIPLEPEYYVFQHESGKKYKVYAKDLTKYESLLLGGWYGAKIYGEFLEQYPNLKYINEQKVNPILFKLDEGKLPMGYIGCSRSYIESVIGAPHSYAGPGISQYEGYTFTCHINVAWDMPESEDRAAAGLIIYYDENMQAVYMEKKPISWYHDETFTDIYEPFAAVDSLRNGKEDIITQSEKSGRIAFNPEAELLEEKYAAPGFFDRLYIEAMYVLENRLGITNMWLIALILIVLQMIFTSVVYFVQQIRMPIPGWIFKIICLLYLLPLTAFTVIYAMRLPFLLAAVVGFVNCSYAIVMMAVTFSIVKNEQCRKCNSWCDEFIILDSKLFDCYFTEISIVGDSRKTVFYTNDSSCDGGVTTTIKDSGYNYRTTVNLVRVMRYKFKCPKCGYVWEQTREDFIKLPGPICYSEHVITKESWTETEITTKRYSLNGSTIHEEEEISSHRRSRTGGSYTKRFDIERYNQYARQYQRTKDMQILRKYESEFYGKYLGQSSVKY